MRGGGPLKGERTIPVFSSDEEVAKDLHDMAQVTKLNKPHERYPPNIITSTRYTLLNFLPKSLLEQFRRLANVYFLVIGGIAFIGYLTSYFQTAIQPQAILAPVVIVVLVSVIKDGVEDTKRYRADKAINSQPTRVLTNTGSIKSIIWKDIQVGDILMVFRDEEIPADAVVLVCGGVQGPVCYVETAAIDGETNLKMKMPSLPCQQFERSSRVINMSSSNNNNGDSKEGVISDSPSMEDMFVVSKDSSHLSGPVALLK